MLVTDIINAGTYSESGDAITSQWSGGDITGTIVFAIQDDGTLVDDRNQWVWTPVAPAFSQCD